MQELMEALCARWDTVTVMLPRDIEPFCLFSLTSVIIIHQGVIDFKSASY